MRRDDLSWMIGGAQGSGVDTPASIFAKALAAAGYHVYGTREYYSNIKGEHSYFQVRFGKRFLRSHVNTIDILSTFDDETIARHAFEVRKGGAIIFDEEFTDSKIEDIPTMEANVQKFLNAELDKGGLPHTINGILEAARRMGVHLYPIPYADVLRNQAEKLGEASAAPLARMTNVMSVAGALALVSFPRDVLAEAIRKQFKSKPKVAEMNVLAVDATYEYVAGKFGESFGYKVQRAETEEKRVLIRGSSVIGIAKIAAGCRLQTYYPITPASDESEYLEEHESLELSGMLETAASKGSIAVIQTEDEIAAILMAIGGGLSGVRAATSTSGPGFSLMAEGLGWAGMNEVPVVVTLYQRGGPSTGLPTRHEQGDLRFTLHTGHGEFPRIVLASGDLEESFYDVAKAFNFAERYQLPVIHLLDKAMANADQTCPIFLPERMKIDRGLLTKGPLSESDAERFKRFSFTESGVSPRPVIGAEGGVYWNSGDEHDEKGHITEDPTNRDMMMEKRMGKLDAALREIPVDDKLVFHGPTDAPLTVVSWGSPKGAILDAMDALRDQDGIVVNFLQLRLLSPFPAEEVVRALSPSKRIVDVEMNYSAQFAGLLREKTGVSADHVVVKYNGRPMSCEEIYDALKTISSGAGQAGAPSPARMVLRSGA